MEKTVVELFAGVGGFRLGLEHSGWKTVWANQWEPSTKVQHAFSVYVANFGEKNVVNEDINIIDKHQIPNHTLLVGGFPCQDYSVARTKATGIQGKKGVLWWSIKETIEIKKPPFILLENVDRLIKSPASQRGRDFGVMLRSLHDLGYCLEWRVINAAEYGFPQRRRRVFMFGAHNSTEYYKEQLNMSKEDLLLKNGFFIRTFKLNKTYDSKKSKTETSIDNAQYKDLVSVSDKFQSTFHNSGIMIEGKILSLDVKPSANRVKTLRTVLIKNPPDKLFIDNNKSAIERFRHLKGSKKEKRMDKNGYVYNYSEGGMSFPDDIDKPARTILTSESSINRSTHVITDPVTNKWRLLSPEEVEKLNGFPVNWTNPKTSKIPITDKRRYFFMGNALVVGLVKKMGKVLEEIVSQESN